MHKGRKKRNGNIHEKGSNLNNTIIFGVYYPLSLDDICVYLLGKLYKDYGICK